MGHECRQWRDLPAAIRPARRFRAHLTDCDPALLIVSRKTLPADNLTGLIAWLKANAGKASQGNSGVGTPSHVSGILFQNAIGARWQMIPYRSARQTLNDLIAGQIDVALDTPATSKPH